MANLIEMKNQTSREVHNLHFSYSRDSMVLSLRAAHMLQQTNSFVGHLTNFSKCPTYFEMGPTGRRLLN